MKSAVVILAMLGVAVAVPTREKRQVAGCVNAFQNVPNVCVNNPTSQVFFSHPSDPTKFLQCDVLNRMYVIQCPAGEVFDISQSGCHPAQQQVTPRPFTLPVTTPRPMITVTPNSPQVNANNPCTAQNVARGLLYFTFAGDNTKFYECDLQGNPSILSCPNLLVWDQNILSCVYPVDLKGTGGNTLNPRPTPQIPAGQNNNPCTQQALSSGRLFFPHPDSTKYIQCDLWGDAFVNSCPARLVWNAYLETCYSPYAQAINGK